MSVIAFVESNTTGTGELFVRAALRRGLRPYFLTADRQRYAFLRELPVVTVAIDTSNVDKLVEFLAAVPDLAAVFSSSEFYIGAASEAAERLGLHTANTEAIKTCRDKARLAEVLQAHGVDVPRSVDLPLLDLAKADLERLRYPVVVKPRTGSGSVDVMLNTNVADVVAQCERMRREGQVWALMQEYVTGEEFSVETLTLGGRTRVLAIVRKHLGAEPFFVEIGHSFPSGLTAAQRARVEACVQAALDAVGFTFGPAHTELRMRGERVTIIEINPRLAGGMIPALLHEVLDFDVIDHVLSMWLGSAGLPEVSPRRFGAIRFAMPHRAGQLAAVPELPAAVAALPELRLVKVLRQPGDHVEPARDFRDRVAVVVCAGDHQVEVERTAQVAAASFSIELSEPASARPAPARKPLPEALRRIVYRDPGDRAGAQEAEWQHLMDIDEAHLIMLGETGLVARDSVRQLIAAHHALRATHSAGLGSGARSRGLYMQLEQHLIDTLGEHVGGALQTGRSRNDINATTTKLVLRSAATHVIEGLLAMRRDLVYKATHEAGKPFPIYSQYQPALPGTVSHQLLAFEAALAAECSALLGALVEVDICPMGAGAGGGTTLAIDPELACRLLGFDRPAVNSLDAVASRSATIHVLSALNATALVLTRIAQDLQVWSTVEFGLVRFPEELTGGSSMLPQKRNPFLVEFIKGRSSVALASLLGCCALVGKAPYTNSFEVGSQLNHFVVDADQAVTDMLRVATALINGMEFSTERAEQLLRDGAVAALAVAESLVQREGVSFRTAHGQVGRALHACHATPAAAHAALMEVDPEFVSQPPLAWANRHRAGGGPGSACAADGIARACESLATDQATFRQRQAAWQAARDLRAEACQHLMHD